jgi:hypothetical protein
LDERSLPKVVFPTPIKNKGIARTGDAFFTALRVRKEYADLGVGDDVVVVRFASAAMPAGRTIGCVWEHTYEG